MPWGPAPIVTLTIPEDAGPDDPAIDIGDPSVIPQSLIDYYAALASTVVGAMILRQDSELYEWLALVLDPGGPSLTLGSSELGVTNEMLSLFTSGGVPFLNLCSQGQGITQVLAGGTLALEQDAEMSYAGVSSPRGLVGYIDDPANSAAVAAQSLMLTIPAVTFEDGRAFEFTYGARWLGSVATTPVIRFQRTNLAGAVILGDYSHPANTTPYTFTGGGIAVNNAGTITLPVALTMGATVGTCQMQSAVRNRRFIAVHDVGAASDYPGAPQI